MNIYLSLHCLCVCVCMCVRESLREHSVCVGAHNLIIIIIYKKIDYLIYICKLVCVAGMDSEINQQESPNKQMKKVFDHKLYKEYIYSKFKYFLDKVSSGLKLFRQFASSS